MLLRNYRSLGRLVVDVEMYMEDGKRERSKSLVTYRSNGGGLPPGEAEDEAELMRAKDYIRTSERFREIDRVVKLFDERKEMPVIRMYYFGETKDGELRTTKERYITFEEVADALGISERTARTWRSQLVTDMAVNLFGTGAALEAAAFRKQRQRGLTSTE